MKCRAKNVVEKTSKCFMCSSPSAAQEDCVSSDRPSAFHEKITSKRGCFIKKGVYFKTFLKLIESVYRLQISPSQGGV